MNFIVKLADKRFKLHCLYDENRLFFKDYIVDDKDCDLELQWTLDEVLAEQSMTEELNCSLPYLETLTALRKIADTLPLNHRLLMHGASIAYEGQGYLFTAPSGTGKTTHIKLWRKYLGNKVDIINGDKPFISLEEPPTIYGTPWAGKENWHKNHHFPLAGICFVHRGTENKIRRLAPSECLSEIFNQIYIPNDPLSAGTTLELVDKLVKTVPLWSLECDMSAEAVKCSFEAMTNQQFL